MVTAGLVEGYGPNVYRAVTAGDLKAVSGMPKRCAAFLRATSVGPTTAFTFTGPDGVNVVQAIPTDGIVEMLGDFSTLVSITGTATVVAGWIDTGKVQLNP